MSDVPSIWVRGDMSRRGFHWTQPTPREGHVEYHLSPAWVSVERPPEEDGDYLAWDGQDRYIAQFEFGGWWYHDGQDKEITHYQPLPPSPIREEA